MVVPIIGMVKAFALPLLFILAGLLVLDRVRYRSWRRRCAAGRIRAFARLSANRSIARGNVHARGWL